MAEIRSLRADMKRLEDKLDNICDNEIPHLRRMKRMPLTRSDKIVVALISAAAAVVVELIRAWL
jgi:uncharacterized protein Yka (UPF0111/DUF47 family)